VEPIPPKGDVMRIAGALIVPIGLTCAKLVPQPMKEAAATTTTTTTTSKRVIEISMDSQRPSEPRRLKQGGQCRSNVAHISTQPT
jgi:hypothetical protein